MPTPRFTVLMPTRNRAHYLPGALESALAQTHRDYEIVVSNCNSRDATEDVVRRMADGRVRLVNPGRDLSMAAHWEFALTHARGEYVLLLCDDDAFRPDLLDVVDARLANGDDDIVMWNAHAYWHADHPEPGERGVARIYPVTGANFDLAPQRLLQHAFSLGSTQFLPRMLNSCTRRAVLERARDDAGGLFWGTCPDFSSAVLQLARARRVAFIDRPLAVWGVGKDSIGRSSGDQSEALHEHLTMTASPLSRVPCRRANTALNHVTESYLIARERAPDRLGRFEIAWESYFRRLRIEVQLMGARGVEIAALLDEVDASEREYASRAPRTAERDGARGAGGRITRAHDWVLGRVPAAWQVRMRTGSRAAGRFSSIAEFVAVSARLEPPRLGPLERYILGFRRRLLTGLGDGATPAPRPATSA
jgi:hypothetical protein